MTDSRRAVFLDRDGVINRPIVRNGKPYPPDTLAEFELLPGTLEAVSALKRRSFWICVVTNQPDVARGKQPRSMVESMHDVMRSMLPIDAVYVCYHDDGDGCECRKPKPGLLIAAAAAEGISLPNSYMIGDRWRDIDCGRAAGCTTILLERGYQESLRRQPHFRALDLLGAAGIICSFEGDSR